MQVDGYGAYKALTRRTKPGRIRLAFCLAHARRKFVAVHKTTQSPIALEVVERIAAIYAIEDRIRGGTAEQRCAVRQTESEPLMNDLKRRLTGLLGGIVGEVDPGEGDPIHASALGRPDDVPERRTRGSQLEHCRAYHAETVQNLGVVSPGGRQAVRRERDAVAGDDRIDERRWRRPRPRSRHR